jgi:hypothetical protein
MELLLSGVLICNRGDLFLSLPMTDRHLSRASIALEEFIDRYKPLITRALHTKRQANKGKIGNSQ